VNRGNLRTTLSSNLFGESSVRSRLAFGHSPVFPGNVGFTTSIRRYHGSDCERGRIVRVESPQAMPKNPRDRPRCVWMIYTHGKDFFGRSTYLTVSGTLEAERVASALRKFIPLVPTSGRKLEYFTSC